MNGTTSAHRGQAVGAAGGGGRAGGGRQLARRHRQNRRRTRRAASADPCFASRGKEGLGRAYIAGFKWALEHSYEFIFEMDCDFSHNPDDIPAFLEAAKDADLVLGSRYVGGIRVINWPLAG